jgi:hypothetical protein
MGEMAEAEVREGLLKKKNNVDYYDNCPGCKIDRLKETTPGPPFKLLLYVFVVVLAAGGGSPVPLFFIFYFLCLVSLFWICVFDNERLE